MRVGLMAENPLESAVLASGIVPIAMLEGYAPVYSRAVLTATRLGIFDAISEGAGSAKAVAEACGTNERATEKLLNLLVTMRYLRYRDGIYRLAPHVRRWLLADTPGSIRDLILMKELEWSWIDQMESFVRDGRPLDVHGSMSTDDWRAYQRGMRAQANPLAGLLARRVPVPAGAREMLDIGGSHGYFSVALCRRHPGLRATVLDLPPAVEHAAPLLEREGMGDRVVLRAGDALADDLGDRVYDLIMAFSLVHHFDDATNRLLVRKAARALRPGGYLVIGDALRPRSPGKGGQQGAFFDLYFALTSESGLWSFDEMRSWQVEAELSPLKSISLVPGGGFGLQVAERVAPV
ncbi:MAG: methyltransferase domain-containing protein [Actinomycetota bacterium]|nr:methyltransferase domain-containing protein [Actinomycetota bacterium]